MEPIDEYRQQERLASPEVQAAVLSDAMRRSTDMNSVVKKVLSRRGRRTRKQANSLGLGMPSGETLGNMGRNAGRFIRGGTSALAGGLGHVGTGIASLGQSEPSSLHQATGDLARAGVSDMWSSMTGADTHQPWAVDQVFDRVRSAPGVTPGVAQASRTLQRGGEMAATAAMGTGAAGLARAIPGAMSTPAAGMINSVNQPLTMAGTAMGAGRAAAETGKALPFALGSAAAFNHITEPEAGAQDAQTFTESLPQQEAMTSNHPGTAAPPTDNRTIDEVLRDTDIRLGLPPWQGPNAPGQAGATQPPQQQNGGMPSPPGQSPTAGSPAPQTAAGAPPGAAPNTPGTSGLPADPSQVTDTHILASDDQSLTQYIERLPPEQQGELVQRAFTAKVKDNLAKQGIPPEQQAARLQELTAKAEQGGWTPDDLQMAAESAAQSIDPSGQMTQKPGFFEQIMQGVQKMSGWQVGALIAGAGLGLVGIMHGLGGGGLFSSLMMSLLGAGAAAWGSGALDSHLAPLGLPTLSSLTGGQPGAQQGPEPPPQGTTPRPDFPQLGGGSPEQSQQPEGAAAAASWMQPYMAGGSKPNALDAGDVPAIAADWQSGQLQDPQIQQMIGSIPQGERGQLRSQLDRLSWVPRTMWPKVLSSIGQPPATAEALQQLTPQQYRQLQQWLAP